MSLSICLSQCHLKTMEKLRDKTMSSIYVVVVAVVQSRIRLARTPPSVRRPKLLLLFFSIRSCSIFFGSPLPSWSWATHKSSRRWTRHIDAQNFFPMHHVPTGALHVTWTRMRQNFAADIFFFFWNQRKCNLVEWDELFFSFKLFISIVINDHFESITIFSLFEKFTIALCTPSWQQPSSI